MIATSLLTREEGGEREAQKDVNPASPLWSPHFSFLFSFSFLPLPRIFEDSNVVDVSLRQEWRCLRMFEYRPIHGTCVHVPCTCWSVYGFGFVCCFLVSVPNVLCQDCMAKLDAPIGFGLKCEVCPFLPGYANYMRLWMWWIVCREFVWLTALRPNKWCGTNSGSSHEPVGHWHLQFHIHCFVAVATKPIYCWSHHKGTASA